MRGPILLVMIWSSTPMLKRQTRLLREMPTRTAPNQARGFVTEEAQVEEAALPRANPARKTASSVEKL